MRTTILASIRPVNNAAVSAGNVSKLSRISMPLFILFISFFTQTLQAQTTYKLDWASFGWTNGATSGTVTNIASSGVNCTVTIAQSGGAFAFTGGASGTQTPTVGGATFVVAGSSSQNHITMDFATNTDYTDITYVFSSAVTGVKFNVADIDKSNATSTTYFDKITVTGSNGATIYHPVISKYVISSSILGLVAGNSAAANTTSGQGGNSSSNAADQNGTVMIDFGTAVLKSFTIRYSNANGADANPAYQAMAIGNTSFQRVNLSPVANNLSSASLPQGAAATAIPPINAADADGTIASYTITTVPNAAHGTLSIPCPNTPAGATCVSGYAELTNAVLSSNSNAIVLTPAQAAGLRFDPVSTFSGTASFSFFATDNLGSVSNSATYRIPVTTQPPVANNIMEGTMVNTLSATAIQALSASDVDGLISTYQITSLPSTAQGTLSVSCPANLTGATCTGGYQDLTAVVASNYPSGIPLTAAQIATLRFDPAAGYVGAVTFNYNAVDNSGNISNSASYTIPVAASATSARPPLAQNIVAQPLSNTLASTAIPALRATDLDGSVSTYKILSLPSGGTLYCCGGSTIAVNQVLSAAQAATLMFDPLATYTGNAAFTYTATDNTSLVSNTASYTIPVTNEAPVASNISMNIVYGSSATPISPLSGHDADGSIAAFSITSVPTAAQGTISVPCPATFTTAVCTGGYQNLTPAVLAANGGTLVLTPAQAAGIRFAPASGFSGSASFNYTSTDNNANLSTAAVYTLTVDAQPPVSADVTNVVLSNALPATPISNFSATDADGTIASYKIFTLPTTAQGVLSISCPNTLTGATCTSSFQDLTAAVLANYPDGIPVTTAQAASLRFKPATTFTGVANFAYGAVDNAGFNSNTAYYNIPVSGTGNIQPVARNVFATAMPNTNNATTIAGLNGADADGTIAAFTIMSVPPASQGVLSMPCPATPAGATCTGGYADITLAVLAANATGITLTPTQAASLQFDPANGFTGTASFSYTTTDNSGAVSYSANYSIPVTGIAPVAQSITVAAIAQTATATAVTSLSATDADGTIASFYLESLPPAAQGVLSMPCPTTLTGATCTGGYQDLTAAVLGNYPGGLPLTTAQAATLRFDPTAGFEGNAVFNFHAVDNSGMMSNQATYTIPVSALNPISLNVVANKILNGSGPVTIAALNSSDPDGTIGSYLITSLPSTAEGVLSITCPATPAGATCAGGFANLTASVLASNPGGIMLTASQAAALRFTPNSTFNGMTTFNYAAIDNSGRYSNIAGYAIPVGSSSTLPLTLLKFGAERDASDIVVNWKTENETEIDQYEVQWSRNAIDYKTGGTHTANNLPKNQYQLTLRNYTEGLYYVRLKTIESNGRFAYSNVVVVRMGTGAETVSVSPNPVVSTATVRIAAATQGNTTIKVLNMTGGLMYSTNRELLKGENAFTLEALGRFASGTYMVQVEFGGKQLSQKIVIHR